MSERVHLIVDGIDGRVNHMEFKDASRIEEVGRDMIGAGRGCRGPCWPAQTRSRDAAGQPAKISRKVGGKFTAWGSHISGFNPALKPGQKIVQAWRATGWWPDHYSVAIYDIAKTRGGTRLKFTQIGIPPHRYSGHYGWIVIDVLPEPDGPTTTPIAHSPDRSSSASRSKLQPDSALNSDFTLPPGSC